MKYVVSSQEKPQNFPIYSIHSDMDSFILYNVEANPSNTLEVLAAEPKEIKKENLVFKFRNYQVTMKHQMIITNQLRIKNQIPQLNKFLPLLTLIMNMKFFGI